MRSLGPLMVGVVCAAAILVIGYRVHVNSTRPTRTVVHERHTVLVAPPLTPLQARRAKRTSAAKSPDGATRVGSSGARHNSKAPLVVSSRPQKTSGAPKKRKTVKTKPDRRTSPQRAPTTTQPGQNQPPPPVEPQPTITVPAPCVRLPPLAKVGDCG